MKTADRLLILACLAGALLGWFSPLSPALTIAVTLIGFILLVAAAPLVVCAWGWLEHR